MNYKEYFLSLYSNILNADDVFVEVCTQNGCTIKDNIKERMFLIRDMDNIKGCHSISNKAEAIKKHKEYIQNNKGYFYSIEL